MWVTCAKNINCNVNEEIAWFLHSRVWGTSAMILEKKMDFAWKHSLLNFEFLSKSFDFISVGYCGF